MASADLAVPALRRARRQRSCLPLSRLAKMMALAVALRLAVPARAVAQLAIVVNPNSAEGDISLDRLRRLFLGQATTFSSGSPARIATHAGSAAEFDRAALDLPAELVRSRWMAMTFRGEATRLPAEFASVDDVKHFVRDHGDAVAFIPLASVDGSVKVLRVGGRRPTDTGYLTQ